MNKKEILDRLINIKAPVCVSLILTTHRTHPENQKDAIQLKNLIAEANQRLQSEFDNDVASRYTAKLQKIADSIDHSHNDRGLMLFVNDDVEEYLRLPMEVTDRVIIDDTFATRPIVRAMKMDSDYFVLVLSRSSARFIQASSDQVIEEVKSDIFPITDNNLQVATKQEAASAARVTNLMQEFFNRIDKGVNRVRTDNPLPVVVYSDLTNYHQYLQIADYPNTILGHVVSKNADESASNLVKEVWPSIKEMTIANNRERVAELKKSVSAGTFLADLNEIWAAVQEGRGKTIFVEEGYHQPATISVEGELTPITADEISTKYDNDDIVDDMIEYNLKYGGDVVFVEKGSLENFNKIALVTRY